MNRNPLVSIDCTTYNHAPYIRQCLDGFLMQKTNFAFEILIHDDCSLDGTDHIIREYEQKYPDIIKPIYQIENQYSKGVSISATFNYPRVKGKYIAWCEGDDYWTDPMKLQKQVDFLEANPEYGMCYTQAKHWYQAENRFRSKIRGGDHETFMELLDKNTVPTLTAVFRADLYRDYLEEIKPEIKHWRMGDYPMWLWLSHNSKIKFLPEVTGVYRILSVSASHSSIYETNAAFIESTFEIKKFFLERYPQMNLSLDDIQQQQYKRLFSLAFSYKKKDELTYFYKHLRRKSFKMYFKYWVRRYFWR